MTPIEKLLWLQDNTVSISIEINDYRVGYETIEQGCTNPRVRLTEEMKQDCIQQNNLVLIQCYPDTPVGFITVSNASLIQAIEAMYDNVKKLR